MISIGILIFIGFVVGGLGFTQGHIVGSFLRKRFPKGKRLPEIFSIVLFGLYLIYAMVNINRISEVNDSNYSQFVETFDLVSISNSIIPTDLYGWLSIIIPLSVVFLVWVAKIKGRKKKFVQIVGISAAIFAAMVTFDLVEPTAEVIHIYTAYQMGLVAGFLLGSQAFKYIKRRTKVFHFNPF